MKKITFFLCGLFLSTGIFHCQSGSEKLQQQLEKLKKDEDLKHATFGYCVLNAKSGKILTEYNSQVSLVPASTLKTFTTGAALGILGKNFRYETLIQYAGKFDSVKGIIEGDVIIKGSGDPTLNSQYFKKKEDTLSAADVWAGVFKEKGIKKITGKIIADNSCFENDVPGTWIWADIGNYFGAPPNGISYNDNKYSLFYKSGAPGEKTEIISKEPEIPGMKFDNKVIAGGNDDNAFIYGAPGTSDRVIKGTIPPNQKNYEVEGAMPDPAWYCAYAFSQSLKKYGIDNSGTIEIISDKNISDNKRTVKTIYVQKSPTLDKIVYYTNMKSNNHYAETLLKTIAYKKNGYGTSSAGTDFVVDYWKTRGVDADGLFMNDGSGLSRSNATTPFIQASILSKIFRDSINYKSFNASLPVSGISGGMINIGKGTCAEGNMRAKSGYITRARAYAGYVKSKNGEEYSFSVIVNNYSCSPKKVKEKIEDLLILFCEL